MSGPLDGQIDHRLPFRSHKEQSRDGAAPYNPLSIFFLPFEALVLPGAGQGAVSIAMEGGPHTGDGVKVSPVLNLYSYETCCEVIL